MDSKLRTVIIALLSLVAMLSVYLLYNRLSETPRIDIENQDQLTETFDQTGIDEGDSALGRIADVGVGTVSKFEYLHRNEANDVDRIFGFEELLHKRQNQWEIKMPYLDILLPDLQCHIIADRGNVDVESAAGGLSAKDATFTGNVIMHILPEKQSVMKESFIYLDDIAFVSEKSLFTTDGTVKFICQDAQMLGTGMELIFNGELNRVEFFRLVDLESLRFSNPKAFPLEQATEAQRNGGTEAQRNVATDADKSNGIYYRCVFSKNVVIDSPEQLVFAEDKISVNNIFFSRTLVEKAAPLEAADANDVQPVSAIIAPDLVGGNDVEKELPKTGGDIVITCDGGITITPMDTDPNILKQNLEFKIEDSKLKTQNLKLKTKDTQRPTCIAGRIDYDAVDGQMLCSGPIELGLNVDVNDLIGKQSKTFMPMKVTAQKEASFLPASNQIVLTGNCVATLVDSDPNIQRKYSLSAEKFTVGLSEKTIGRSPPVLTNIRYVTGSDGTVTLSVVKSAGGELLGGVRLECSNIYFDAAEQLFSATGPGQLAVDNSRIPQPRDEAAGFSLRKQCYAILSDFDKLQYFLQPNKILADAHPDSMLTIDYFPVIEGEYARHAQASAGRVEINLVQTASGDNEISTLTASDGITYQDQDNQFAGSSLFYDREKSMVKVEGDKTAPCYFNGALVDRIVYDPKTGKVDATVVGPGAVQIK